MIILGFFFLMKLIKLNNDLFCQVSDCDFDWINERKWVAEKSYSNNRNVYYAISGYIRMHRLIMGCKKGDSLKIDHIDGNGLNNQRENLRICSHSENMSNRIKTNTSTSIYLGVWLRNDNRKKKWVAQIGKNNKVAYMKSFYTEIEAAIAYNENAKRIHGEYARLNII